MYKVSYMDTISENLFALNPTRACFQWLISDIKVWTVLACLNDLFWIQNLITPHQSYSIEISNWVETLENISHVVIIFDSRIYNFFLK